MDSNRAIKLASSVVSRQYRAGRTGGQGMAVARMIAGFVAAVLTALIAASIVHTGFVVSALGVEVPAPVAVRTWAGDLAGLAPQFGAVIGIALLLGFLVAAAARRWVPLPPALAYAFAGGAAMATALWLMKRSYDITPIASARSTAGFLALCLAGALGGIVFAAAARRRRA
jgi:hypothetical protein